MARTFVDDGTDMFRVCITYKQIVSTNPAYDWRTARETGERQYIYSETETYTKFFGPYKSEGIAKAQLSFRMQYRPNSNSEGAIPYDNVVSGHYEKANIIWEVAGSLS